MIYTQDPAEQTTAITDIILALVAFGGILFLVWQPANINELWRVAIWSAALGMIGLAASLGAAAHGLIISRTVYDRIWQLLNMTLALAVSLFVVGVVYDLWGPTACFKALPVMLFGSLVFFVATLVYPGIFFIFIVYQGLSLFFAFGAYLYLTVRGGLAGTGFIAAGILLSILAAGIQANQSISLTVVWRFDHNGIYHIVQVIGLMLLVYGIRLSML
jgi:hypothetical protein